MKYLIFIFLLASCGLDSELYYPIGDTITFESRYHETTFKYVVVKYPNGNVDSYCELNNGTNKQTKTVHYYENDFDIDEASCTLFSDLYQYWEFYRGNNTAYAKWVGSSQPVDAINGQAFPFSFEFLYKDIEKSYEEILSAMTISGTGRN